MPIFKKKNEDSAEGKNIEEPLTEVKNNKKETVTKKPKKTENAPETKETESKKTYTTKKKKPFLEKDMKEKPVYLEDTGEKLGTIFDTIYDKDQKIVGYKIKDEKSDAVLSFPIDQFDYDKDGLIFVPGWYNAALKTIEKLEFKDKISPELTTLLSDDAVSNDELYDIFVKHDDEMADYIDNAKSLHEMLANRLKVLEKQRAALKDDLLDLTEKRLIKDIDRRQFSEDILDHRRKANILDININKCRDLIKRLDNTSFGVLGKNYLLNDKKMKKEDKKSDNTMLKKIIETEAEQSKQDDYDLKDKKQDIYKDKYFTLKEQFEQLNEEYQELKMAVDKLVNKENL
jgi:hypothetical protein